MPAPNGIRTLDPVDYFSVCFSRRSHRRPHKTLILVGHRFPTLIDETAQLPDLLPKPYVLNLGFVLALVAVVAVYIILNRTSLGYEMRAVGFNPNASRTNGINVNRNMFLALLISGALAGLAESRPETPDEALEVRGIGIAKLTTIVPQFLREIARWKAENRDP